MEFQSPSARVKSMRLRRSTSLARYASPPQRHGSHTRELEHRVNDASACWKTSCQPVRRVTSSILTRAEIRPSAVEELTEALFAEAAFGRSGAICHERFRPGALLVRRCVIDETADEFAACVQYLPHDAPASRRRMPQAPVPAPVSQPGHHTTCRACRMKFNASRRSAASRPHMAAGQ